MTIEIRQMLIKSSVEDDDRPARAQDAGDADDAADRPDTEQTRQELLAECKAWLFEKLQNQRER